MTRPLALVAALALLVTACGGTATPAATPAATAATKSDTNEQGNTSQVQTQAPAASAGPDEGALDRAMLGTVQIYILDPENRITGACSGTNFHPAGYIVTNWHCVGVTHTGGREPLPHGMRYHPQGYVAVGPTKDAREAPSPTYIAQLITGSPDLDIAVLKIVDSVGRGTTLPDRLALPVVPTGDSDKVKPGEKAHMIGYPAAGGAFITRSAGTIAGFSDRNEDNKPDAFKTDMKAGAGVSGGLLVNDKGEQIGVPVGALVGAPGDIFISAIFINLAKPFMEQAVSLAGTNVGPPSGSITLPGTAPSVSGTKPTATPRVTPTPRPTPSATATGTPRPTGTAAGTPGASPTTAPGEGTATSTSIVISGNIVDADTKRPIAGARFIVMKDGVTEEQVLDADDPDSLVLTYSDADSDGAFVLEPIAKGKRYVVFFGADGYTPRLGWIDIPTNAPDTGRLKPWELKKK